MTKMSDIPSNENNMALLENQKLLLVKKIVFLIYIK